MVLLIKANDDRSPKIRYIGHSKHTLAIRRFDTLAIRRFVHIPDPKKKKFQSLNHFQGLCSNQISLFFVLPDFCADHVETGKYISPEFRLGQVWDGDGTGAGDGNNNDDDVILYRPVYVKLADRDRAGGKPGDNNIKEVGREDAENLCEICAKILRKANKSVKNCTNCSKMCQKSHEMCQNLLKIARNFCQKLDELMPKLARNYAKLCQKFHKNLPKILHILAQKSHEILSKIGRTRAKMAPKFFPNLRRSCAKSCK